MNRVLFVLLLSTCGSILAEESSYCDTAENFRYEHIPSNVSFSVLLKLHEGEDCSVEDTRYMQKASDIITSIYLINMSPILEGVKIGAEIFDTCLLKECMKADNDIVPHFVIQPNGTYFLGTLVPEELLDDKVSNGIPLSPRFTISRGQNTRLLVTAAVRTLRRFKLRKIDVLFASSSVFSEEFAIKATWAVICVKKRIVSTDYSSLCECKPNRRTIVISLSSERLPEFQNATSTCGCNDRFVLVLTSGDVDMATLEEYTSWMNDSYVIGPADLLIKFPEIKSEEEALSLKSNLSTLDYTLDFMSTSAAVSRIFQSLKIKLKNECGRSKTKFTLCPELTEFGRYEALVSTYPFIYDIEELSKNMQLSLEKMALYVSLKVNEMEISPIEIITKDMIYNETPMEIIQSTPTIVEKKPVCHDEIACSECPNFVFEPKAEGTLFWKDFPLRFKNEIRKFPKFVAQSFLNLVELFRF